MVTGEFLNSDPLFFQNKILLKIFFIIIIIIIIIVVINGIKPVCLYFSKGKKSTFYKKKLKINAFSIIFLYFLKKVEADRELLLPEIKAVEERKK